MLVRGRGIQARVEDSSGLIESAQRSAIKNAPALHGTVQRFWKILELLGKPGIVAPRQSGVGRLINEDPLEVLDEQLDCGLVQRDGRENVLAERQRRFCNINNVEGRLAHV